MNCFFVNNHLSAFQDGFLTGEPAEEVKNHLETCPACRELAEDLRRLQPLVAGLPRLSEDASLRARVRARLLQQRLARPWYRQPLYATGLILIVGFLVLGWALTVRLRGAGQLKPPLLAAAPTFTAQAVPDEPVGTPILTPPPIVPKVTVVPAVAVAVVTPSPAAAPVVAVGPITKIISLNDAQLSMADAEVLVLGHCQKVGCKPESGDETIQFAESETGQRQVRFALLGRSYVSLISRLKALGTVTGSRVDPKVIPQDEPLAITIRLEPAPLPASGNPES